MSCAIDSGAVIIPELLPELHAVNTEPKSTTMINSAIKQLFFIVKPPLFLF